MRSRLALPLLASALLSCATVKGGIRPFSSDGCTLSRDGTPDDKQLWCSCCFEHDIAYWHGGTALERMKADEALRACVLEKSHDPQLAELMYDGTRLGGSPLFPMWYRWGYGWPYGRGYQALTAEERADSEERLREYFRAHPEGHCTKP